MDGVFMYWLHFSVKFWLSSLKRDIVELEKREKRMKGWRRDYQLFSLEQKSGWQSTDAKFTIFHSLQTEKYPAKLSCGGQH